MRRNLLCVAVWVVLFALGGCPPEAPSDWIAPADLKAVAKAPAAVQKGEAVVLTAQLNHEVDLRSVLYRWFQTYGRVVEITNADSAEASFVAPSLPTDQTLRFRVDVQAPDGTIYSATVEVLVAADPDYGGDESAAEEEDSGEKEPYPRVRLVTSMGTIVVELDRVKAPLTVNNFLRYLDDGFYDGTIFHRVIPDFVVQGGGYDPGLAKKDTRPPIVSEADNGLKNERGTIAMARKTDADSATSQFYINLADNDNLDYGPGSVGYTVFGRVIQGMVAVDAIGRVETESREGFDDVPVNDVTIRRAERVGEATGDGGGDSGGGSFGGGEDDGGDSGDGTTSGGTYGG